MEWRIKMKICDNCGRKLNETDTMLTTKFPIAIVEIIATLDQYGTKKRIDLCQRCQNDIYNMIMDSEVQNIDYEI